jgi:hypothetical protein
MTPWENNSWSVVNKLPQGWGVVSFFAAFVLCLIIFHGSTLIPPF